MTMYLRDRRKWDYEDIDCQFVVCQKCYWTATVFNKRNNQAIKTCPICCVKNISAYSILIHDNNVVQ
jgi:hypothetical protein